MQRWHGGIHVEESDATTVAWQLQFGDVLYALYALCPAPASLFHELLQGFAGVVAETPAPAVAAQSGSPVAGAGEAGQRGAASSSSGGMPAAEPSYGPLENKPSITVPLVMLTPAQKEEANRAAVEEEPPDWGGPDE